MVTKTLEVGGVYDVTNDSEASALVSAGYAAVTAAALFDNSGTNNSDDIFPVAASSSSGIANAPGYYDITKYTGVVFNRDPGTTVGRQANGAALQAALDYCITNKLMPTAPAGNFFYDCRTQDVGGTQNVGLQFKVNSKGFFCPGQVYFVQFAPNHPAITLGNLNAATPNAYFTGMTAVHGVSQTGNTQAAGVLIGQLYKSTLENITAVAYPPGGGVNHAYYGLQIGRPGVASYFFSNVCRNFSINTGQDCIFRVDADGTGNAWDSLYLGGGSIGDLIALAGPAMYVHSVGSAFGSIQQLNIEWMTTYAAMTCDNARNMTMIATHFEGIKLTANGNFVQNVLSSLRFITIEALNVQINNTAPAASAGWAVFKMYSDGQITVDQMQSYWDSSVAGNPSGPPNLNGTLYTEDVSLTGRAPSVLIRNFTWNDPTGAATFDLDVNRPSGTYGKMLQFQEYRQNPVFSRTQGGNIILPSGNGAFTVYGCDENARLVLNTPISANRTTTVSSMTRATGIGSTTPRRVGDLVRWNRQGNATGAFNWIIANVAAATIGTPSGAVNTDGALINNATDTWSV